ncbi:FecCD family ABC transporter permease [Schlesneria paludicola]|uniref:FecCD family ABC transporter permease n=1 Tax=Schlesneria paludicola TaxID=360056 RepID=UPI00029A73C5|nr:iron ABC transporter permease [Schlesneria paludicola]
MSCDSSACQFNDEYRRRRLKRLSILIVVALLTAGSFVVDLITGPAALSLQEIASTIFRPTTVSRTQQVIVWSFRLPTAILGIAVGSALGLAGSQMQSVLNNRLASPYTLGVSAAAAFGAALVIVFGTGRMGLASTVAIPAGAFISALGCSLALFAIGRSQGGASETLIVAGVALHFLFSSGLALLQYTATNDALNAIIFWTFGSLQGATWHKVAILAVVLCGTFAVILPKVWQLTALQLGDEYALSLGVDVGKLKLQTILVVSVLTATAVCFTGSIGFVGLVAPHLARMAVGEDQRFFIVLSAGFGALLVSLAAVLCKTVVPGTVFPIGIVTAAIGSPVFAAMAIWTRRTRP